MVVLGGWRCIARPGCIAADLRQLDELVRGWQHAYDHQITGLYCRLTGIETAAGSSRRAVSELLLVDLDAAAGSDARGESDATDSAVGSGRPEVGERS